MSSSWRSLFNWLFTKYERPLPSCSLSSCWSRMGQRRFQVRYPGQEDGIALVMVIALEHELVPVRRVGAVFQEPMQPVLIGSEARLRQPRLRNCNQSSLLAIRMYGVVKAMQ